MGAQKNIVRSSTIRMTLVIEDIIQSRSFLGTVPGRGVIHNSKDLQKPLGSHLLDLVLAVCHNS